MAISYSKHGFNDLTYARLSEYTNSSAITLRLIHGYVANLLQGWASGRNMFVTLRDVEGNIEVCKITDIQGDNLTVARGQDGTTARNWPAGTLVAQRSVGDSLGRIIQKGEFKTIDYNPNGVLVPDYPNEKVYQSGDLCHRRWWIHALDNKWRLVVGDKCDDEYWDNGWLWELQLQQLFAFGGQNDTDATDQFDPDLNSWAEKTNMGANRLAAAAASPGGTDGINVFGGSTNNGDHACQDNEHWGTGLSYTTKTDMPTPPRAGHMAVGSYGDYAYCFGGKDYTAGPTVLSDNDRYSETGDSWIVRQAVPSPARMAGAAGRAYLGEIYNTAGESVGYAQGNAKPDHDEYNESGDSWTGKTDLSPERSECCGATDLDYFYISGGRTLGLMSEDFDYFYPTGNSWTALTNLIDGVHYEMHGSGQDSSGGATYHVGGDQDGWENTTREYYFGWSYKQNCPNPKGYFTMAQSLDFDGLGA